MQTRASKKSPLILDIKDVESPRVTRRRHASDDDGFVHVGGDNVDDDDDDDDGEYREDVDENREDDDDDDDDEGAPITKLEDPFPDELTHEKSYAELERLTREARADKSRPQERYSWEEIKRHNTRRSCWIVIHGRVYDVTHFLHTHPGGDETLVEVAGRDASEAFEDSRHPTIARKLMLQYDIGVTDGSANPEEDYDFCAHCLPITIVILLVVILSAAYYFDLLGPTASSPDYSSK